jgi:hypothetical protein
MVAFEGNIAKALGSKLRMSWLISDRTKKIMCGYPLTGQKIDGGEYLAKARPFCVKIYSSCAGLSF